MREVGVPHLWSCGPAIRLQRQRGDVLRDFDDGGECEYASELQRQATEAIRDQRLFETLSAGWSVDDVSGSLNALRAASHAVPDGQTRTRNIPVKNRADLVGRQVGTVVRVQPRLTSIANEQKMVYDMIKAHADSREDDQQDPMFAFLCGSAGVGKSQVRGSCQ